MAAQAREIVSLVDGSQNGGAQFSLTDADCEEKLRKAESLLVQAGRAADAVNMYAQRGL